MIPNEWEDALDVRLWDRFFDAYVQAPMQQIVADRLHGTNGDMKNERAALETAYGMIERRMASRSWIAGSGFSMADCAAAPALFYAGTVLPFPDRFTHLKTYFDRLADRPSFQRVIAEARPYFAFYPFAEAIPQRFLQGG